MGYVVFDTETNDLPPKKRQLHPSNLHEWPHVVQFAANFYDDDETLLMTQKSLVKPDGWLIKPECEAIHGISHARALVEGRLALRVFGEFFIMLEKFRPNKVVFNLGFDDPIIQAEFMRLNIPNIQLPGFCLMLGSAEFVGIPSQWKVGEFKWPKLEQLYSKLFPGETFNGHDAGDDVVATARCFFEMKKRGLLPTCPF